MCDSGIGSPLHAEVFNGLYAVVFQRTAQAYTYHVQAVRKLKSDCVDPGVKVIWPHLICVGLVTALFQSVNKLWACNYSVRQTANQDLS